MRFQPYDKSHVARLVKRYVDRERHYRELNLTSSIVAEEIGVARSTLIKVMKEEVGMTFSEYLNACRLRHARRLLRQGGGRRTVESVALLSGFGTVFTFNKKYKEMYGELPSVAKEEH